MNATRPVGSLRQQGAVLVVTMILLFVCALLGVASMQNATLQERLVFNVVAKEATFRAAESGAEALLADPSILKEAVKEENHASGVSLDLTLPNSKVILNSTMRSAGTGFSRGNSTKFRAHKFTLTGVSTIADVNTSTTVEQGFEQLLPSQ